MLTFLFWNLKQARPDILASLVGKHAVDVVLLAECPLLPATVLKALNPVAAAYFFTPGKCPKIAIYTKFSEQYVKAQAEGDDYTIRNLALPGRPELLLCVVHFPSKLRQAPIDQVCYAMNFSTHVLNPVEEQVSHSRTILVGDLNMNPYEDGVVVTSGLHAVMTREIARRETRKVKFESNKFFYNPMWRHFGQRSEGHAGTYYLASPKARADFWNVYDQILLRPGLLPYFRDEDVEVLHRDLALDLSFLRRGIPDYDKISDHLPILFRLQL